MSIRFFIFYLFFSLTLFANTAKPLTITGDRDYAPFSYLDSENKAQGLLVDVWREWATAINTEVRFELKEWQLSLNALKNK
jgi:ABC-type amino acid transport substrate-binding protein